MCNWTTQKTTMDRFNVENPLATFMQNSFKVLEK